MFLKSNVFLSIIYFGKLWISLFVCLPCRSAPEGCKWYLAYRIRWKSGDARNIDRNITGGREDKSATYTLSNIIL